MFLHGKDDAIGNDSKKDGVLERRLQMRWLVMSSAKVTMSKDYDWSSAYPFDEEFGGSPNNVSFAKNEQGGGPLTRARIGVT